MAQSPNPNLKPAKVVVTDFYRPGDLQPDAETSARAAMPRQLTFHIQYDGSDATHWSAMCPEVSGFVAEGIGLGHAEIGAAILDQLADFRDPQP